MQKDIKINTIERRLRKKNVLDCKLVKEFNNVNNSKTFDCKFEHLQKQRQKNEFSLIKNKYNSIHQNSVWHKFHNNDNNNNVKSQKFLDANEINPHFNRNLNLDSFQKTTNNDTTFCYENSKILQNNNNNIDHHLIKENNLLNVSTTTTSNLKLPFCETQLDFREIDSIIGLEEKENIRVIFKKN